MTKIVEILATFRGDPENTGHATTSFRAGEKPLLEDAYADLLIAKGLACEERATAPDPANKPTSAIPDAPKR